MVDMSYRNVRNLLEMLRALGYPKLVSMESFRSPNFTLVSDLLVWLAQRFDPESEFDQDISSEDKRVKLVQDTVQFMALKAGIRLNSKKLYQADGYSVKELLKVTTVLYEALNIDLERAEDSQRSESESLSLRDLDVYDKANELKLSRQLASEITTTGANLFDLLGKEENLKFARNKTINRQYELPKVESDLKQAIELIAGEISETKYLIENVSATEASLDSKIERRNIEIDRYEKRLQTLKKVRPAFLEEFTALEQELEQLFVQYSVRLRCLNFLERQFSDSERSQLEKQLQLAAPQVIPIENFDESDVFLEKNERERERSGAINRQERPRAGTGGRKKSEKGARIYGSMQPSLFESQSSLDLSSDTGGSDELFLNKDELDMINSDEDSLGLELSDEKAGTASGRKTAAKVLENESDDDF